MFGTDGESSGLVSGCYTLDYVPGRKVIASLGLVEYTVKNIAGNAPEKMQSVFSSLLEAALDQGAHAVINVRMVTGSYQKQGSQWMVSYIVAYGEAVLLE
ncbi:hypothetical protein LYZ37_23825 (plasmid) [Vibrio tubiashii]|uniref:hypothetical protein n=1 Tax=Vibrio tubiashii TaxID=29498 RepID=UPI00234EDAAD|nr:hypothetical protein [Vibrio tubiashii]WCP70196.1 hypothetical protein LYZ37_23825 [Vibrio tubiashii]